jgi:hypothetical protein
MEHLMGHMTLLQREWGLGDEHQEWRQGQARDRKVQQRLIRHTRAAATKARGRQAGAGTDAVAIETTVRRARLTQRLRPFLRRHFRPSAVVTESRREERPFPVA